MSHTTNANTNANTHAKASIPATADRGLDKINRLADTATQAAADQADLAIGSTRQGTHAVLDQLQESVDHLRDRLPGAVSRATAQADRLARRSLDQARQASAQVRQRVQRAGEHTVDRIRDEPVKSVLIAAAGGALLAMLVGLVLRSDRR